MRSKLSDHLSETQFQNAIIDAAQQLGWWTHHHLRSKGSSAGWPDLVLLKPPRALFFELKDRKGIVSPDQERVLALLEACGFTVGVYRPSQYDDVLAILQGRNA